MPVLERMQQEMSIFNGSMLGDACLIKRKRYANAYFGITLSGAEHLDLLSVLADYVRSSGVHVSSMYPKAVPSRSKGKAYVKAYFNSHVSELLTEQYSLWYKDGIKTVPASLELNPKCLAYWFMLDGDTSINKSRPGWSCVSSNISTHDFALEDVERLQALLHSVGLLGFRIYRRHDCVRGWYLRTSMNDTVGRLLDAVRPYIFPSYQYKIKYPKNYVRL